MGSCFSDGYDYEYLASINLNEYENYNRNHLIIARSSTSSNTDSAIILLFEKRYPTSKIRIEHLKVHIDYSDDDFNKIRLRHGFARMMEMKNIDSKYVKSIKYLTP